METKAVTPQRVEAVDLYSTEISTRLTKWPLSTFGKR